MISITENQELLEDIENPIKKYAIFFQGRFTDVIYDDSSKEEYEFWQTRQAKQNIHADTLFSEYMTDTESEDVPKKFRRQGEWYEQDGILSEAGFEIDDLTITIIELKPHAVVLDTSSFSKVLIDDSLKRRTLVNQTRFYNDFCLKTNVNIIEFDSTKILEGKDYVFYGSQSHSPAGNLMLYETKGRIDLSKFDFTINRYPDGRRILIDAKYDEDDLGIDYFRGIGSNCNTEFLVELQDVSKLQ